MKVLSVLSLPQRLALAGVTALLIAIAAFGAGWKVHSWKVDSAKLKEAREAEAARDRVQALLDAKATELENTRALLDQKLVESHSTIREIYRDIPAPPAECAAPAAARRLLIDAGATGPRTSAPQSAQPVPGATGSP